MQPAHSKCLLNECLKWSLCGSALVLSWRVRIPEGIRKHSNAGSPPAVLSLAETHFSNMWCCNTEGQKWFSRAVVAAVPCCVCSVQLSATWSWEVWGQLPLHPPTWGLRTQASEEGVRLGLRWRKDQHEQRATSVIIWFISRILAPQVLLINK